METLQIDSHSVYILTRDELFRDFRPVRGGSQVTWQDLQGRHEPDHFVKAEADGKKYALAPYQPLDAAINHKVALVELP